MCYCSNVIYCVYCYSTETTEAKRTKTEDKDTDKEEDKKKDDSGNKANETVASEAQ